MKIVKRPAFLKLPPGTVYSKYEPCVFGELQIKGDTLPNGNDWFYQDIAEAVDSSDSGERVTQLFEAEETGKSITMDFDCQGRDGCFESDEQMFAVWERADVEALIARLQATLSS
jgi:hypothetical protein